LDDCVSVGSGWKCGGKKVEELDEGGTWVGDHK